MTDDDSTPQGGAIGPRATGTRGNAFRAGRDARAAARGRPEDAPARDPFASASFEEKLRQARMRRLRHSGISGTGAPEVLAEDSLPPVPPMPGEERADPERRVVLPPRSRPPLALRPVAGIDAHFEETIEVPPPEVLSPEVVAAPAAAPRRRRRPMLAALGGATAAVTLVSLAGLVLQEPVEERQTATPLPQRTPAGATAAPVTFAMAGPEIVVPQPSGVPERVAEPVRTQRPWPDPALENIPGSGEQPQIGIAGLLAAFGPGPSFEAVLPQMEPSVPGSVTRFLISDLPEILPAERSPAGRDAVQGEAPTTDPADPATGPALNRISGTGAIERASVDPVPAPVRAAFRPDAPGMLTGPAGTAAPAAERTVPPEPDAVRIAALSAPAPAEILSDAPFDFAPVSQIVFSMASLDEPDPADSSIPVPVAPIAQGRRVVVHHTAQNPPEAVLRLVGELKRSGIGEVDVWPADFLVARTNVRFYFEDDQVFSEHIVSALSEFTDGRSLSAPRDFTDHPTLPVEGTVEVYLGKDLVPASQVVQIAPIPD